MALDLLLPILAGLLSMGIGSLFKFVDKLFDKFPNSKFVLLLQKYKLVEIESPLPYKERIKKSINSLEAASKEVDKFLLEIKSIGEEKQKSIENLESQLTLLSQKEIELKSKVKALENVPLEAAKYFEEVLNKGNKRSALRDYVLFGLGVLVSTIVAIALNYFSK